jgi:hypothetical protein
MNVRLEGCDQGSCCARLLVTVAIHVRLVVEKIQQMSLGLTMSLTFGQFSKTLLH